MNMELSVRHSDAIDKFTDPHRTADGEPRASVVPIALKTLWFNTGTLCNLACQGCYIESSPRNDSLAYLSRSEVRRFLDEAQRYHPKLGEIGFTGGEPFMNPGIMGMLEDALETGCWC
jgi:MoaA/NifB/PqqE/SkfB family radical SAM enzyme